VFGVVGTIQTIPALALLAFLIPLTGRIGPIPAFIALTLYALLPIVRNTHAAVEQIPRSMIEAAQALGLPRGLILRKIELPLATPTLLAGIKTSAVVNVGTATIAAFIGAGGFGERIVTGLAINDQTTLLAGAIPVAVLALLIQGGFDLLERRIVPEGLRHQREGAV
jgi:osmoprotectant transport system permease protein